MHMRKFALVGVSLLAVSSPAFGQDAVQTNPQPDEAGVDTAASEIVVSARRRDESAQDVPLVVNAVTSEAIEKLNLRRFEEITSVVPGLSLEGNPNGIGQVSTLRGIQFNVNASGNNGTIEFYRNDAPLTGGAVFQSMFDIGQIEVLRGPQGTLRGRASPSGSINITTRRPDLSQAGGYLSGTVTSEHGFNANGAINVPVIGDKLGVRVAGVVSKDRGNDVRANGGRTPFNRTEGLRASVRADPFDGVLLLDFNYETLQHRFLQYGALESVDQVIDGAPASPVTIRAKQQLAGNSLPFDNDQHFEIFNWQAQLSRFGQRLTYVGSRVNQDVIGREPFDKADIFANDIDQFGVPFQSRSDLSGNSTSHEVRLQNEERIADMFDYVVGYFRYTPNSYTLFSRVDGVGQLTPTPVLFQVRPSTSFRYSESKEESVFGNLTVHFGQGTEISGGLRKIWYEIDSGVRLNSETGPEVPSLRRNVKEGKTIYMASIKHEFSNDLMIYASTGSSWRPSNAIIGGPAAPSPRQVAFTTIFPESSKSYEAGFKSTWLDGRLRFNLTAYYQKFKNYPYRSPALGVFAIDRARNAVVPFNYTASVPAEVKGIEAELGFRPVPNWSIDAVMSYAKSKIKSGEIPCLDLDDDGNPDVVTAPPSFAALDADVGANNIDVCTTNQRAGFQSPFSGTIQSEYFMPLTDRIEGFGRGLFSWYGKSQNDPNNAFDDISSYGLLNLYLGARDPDRGWEVTLYGKNITNSFRVLTRTNGPASTVVIVPPATAGQSIASTNYFNITATQPREFGISVRVAFGSR